MADDQIRAQLRDSMLKLCDQMGNAMNALRTAVEAYTATGPAPEQRPATAVETLLTTIKWKESMGAKGPFMLASEQDNATVAAYHELHKILSEMPKGNLFQGTRFIWLLNTEAGGIGMKDKGGAK